MSRSPAKDRADREKYRKVLLHIASRLAGIADEDLTTAEKQIKTMVTKVLQDVG